MITLDELQQQSDRHGGDPETGNRAWSPLFAQQMADALPDLLKIARAMAESAPYDREDYCVFCDGTQAYKHTDDCPFVLAQSLAVRSHTP